MRLIALRWRDTPCTTTGRGDSPVFDGYSIAVLAATALGVGGFLYYLTYGTREAQRDNARISNLRR